MDQIIDLLLYKLSNKGLTPVEIPRLVKDVLNIVSDGGQFTSSAVNRKLEALGWDKSIVDQLTFELIIALLQNEGEYEIKSTTIH
jgi:hypothetical protein